MSYQSVQSTLQGDFLRELDEQEEIISQIVLIGRNLDHDDLKAQFMECVPSTPIDDS